MPVVLHKGRKGSIRSGHLVCEICGKKSKTYEGCSPAAPELTICEAAGKDAGWSYNIGFWSMMMGHQTICPKCQKTEEKG